jgi:hypothetical protein
VGCYTIENERSCTNRVLTCVAPFKTGLYEELEAFFLGTIITSDEPYLHSSSITLLHIVKALDIRYSFLYNLGTCSLGVPAYFLMPPISCL